MPTLKAQIEGGPFDGSTWQLGTPPFSGIRGVQLRLFLGHDEDPSTAVCHEYLLSYRGLENYFHYMGPNPDA